MTKFAEKKKPTEVAVLIILNGIIGFLFWFAGLGYDDIFNTQLTFIQALYLRGILLVEGTTLIISAYGYWDDKPWLGNVFLLIFGFLCGLFGLGAYLNVEWQIFIENISEGGSKRVNNAFKHPFLYYNLMALFGLVYSLLIYVFFLRKPNVRAFFNQTKTLNHYSENP